MTGHFFTSWQSPLCNIFLVTGEKGLTGIHLDTKQRKKTFEPDPEWAEDRNNAILRETIHQLDAYFNKRLSNFQLPLDPSGTPFQKQVWHELEKIPYGALRSYKEIAIAIGNPKAVRAVGMANGKNPLPIVIPCHRVIGANGKLVGYSSGLEMKKQLLELEKNQHG